MIPDMAEPSTTRLPLTVLLVDDNPAVVDVLSQQIALLEPTWTVRTATDAIDVVVSDMRMEEVSGLALLRECKERFPTIARVVLSGQINVAHYLRPAQEVTKHYLCKPVRMRQLRDTILIAAEESQVAQVAQPPAPPPATLDAPPATVHAPPSSASQSQ